MDVMAGGPSNKPGCLQTPEPQRWGYIVDQRWHKNAASGPHGGLFLYPIGLNRGSRPKRNHTLGEIESFADHIIKNSSGRYASVPEYCPTLTLKDLGKSLCSFAILAS